jgi:glyoxylase-like metal-dependent hydrolase (beta-lactamase superfamily II)
LQSAALLKNKVNDMLQYQTIPVTPFQQNSSLVWDDVTKQAAVIDPGGDLHLLLGAVVELKI